MDIIKTGKLISKKRKELSLTQEQLAERLYMTPQAISLWENGKRYPDVLHHQLIMEVLGLNPIELMTGKEMKDLTMKKRIESYILSDGNDPTKIPYIDRNNEEKTIDLMQYFVVRADANHSPSGELTPYAEWIKDEE